MLCLQLETCSQQIQLDGTAACRVTVHSLQDMMGLIESIVDAMAAAEHATKDLLRVRLALEEALVNAHKHGNDSDWSQPIKVRYHVGMHGVVAEIADEGPGFDPGQVPDPCAPENLERTSGRGLLLMRSYMTGVCHNEQGNRVCLCKHRLMME